MQIFALQRFHSNFRSIHNRFPDNMLKSPSGFSLKSNLRPSIKFRETRVDFEDSSGSLRWFSEMLPYSTWAVCLIYPTNPLAFSVRSSVYPRAVYKRLLPFFRLPPGGLQVFHRQGQPSQKLPKVSASELQQKAPLIRQISDLCSTKISLYSTSVRVHGDLPRNNLRVPREY